MDRIDLGVTDELSVGGTGNTDYPGSTVTSVPTVQSGAISIDDGAWLTAAEFDRHGHDLIANGPAGEHLVIVDYFAHDVTPDLDLGAATLRGHLVERLAGPMADGQVAQVGAADTSAVGSVSTVTGEAWAVRVDGTRVALEQGSAIHQGDVLEHFPIIHDHIQRRRSSSGSRWA